MKFPEELTQKMLEEAVKPANERRCGILPMREYAGSEEMFGKKRIPLYKGTRMTQQLAHRKSMFAWAFYNELSFKLGLLFGSLTKEVHAPSGLRRNSFGF